MKKLILAAALGATALTGAAAFAQDAAPRRDPLAQADANGDGVISKEEYQADVAARFATLDADKDGKVTEAERAAARPGGGAGRGMTGDITLADMQAQAQRRFDRFDANHDGKIDQAERDAARERMMAFRQHRADQQGGVSGNE